MKILNVKMLIARENYRRQINSEYALERGVQKRAKNP